MYARLVGHQDRSLGHVFRELEGTCGLVLAYLKSCRVWFNVQANGAVQKPAAIPAPAKQDIVEIVGKLPGVLTATRGASRPRLCSINPEI